MAALSNPPKRSPFEILALKYGNTGRPFWRSFKIEVPPSPKMDQQLFHFHSGPKGSAELAENSVGDRPQCRAARRTGWSSSQQHLHLLWGWNTTSLSTLTGGKVANVTFFAYLYWLPNNHSCSPPRHPPLLFFQFEPSAEQSVAALPSQNQYNGCCCCCCCEGLCTFNTWRKTKPFSIKCGITSLGFGDWMWHNSCTWCVGLMVFQKLYCTKMEFSFFLKVYR